MGLLHESDATLRFFGDSLDPDEITKALGVTPTVGVIRGGTWYTSLGFPKIAGTGSWRLNIGRRKPGDLDQHISELLNFTTDNLHIWRNITTRFRSDIFLGLWLASSNEGFELSSPTLANVASRGLLLDFDIYSRGNDENEVDEAGSE